MAMLVRVRALGVRGGPYYCAQGTAIDGLLARRRYKPLTLADPPFDPHLASDATRYKYGVASIYADYAS